MNKLKYRKEITSLRFFAIIPVVIYHFDKSLVSSGYLGVDVFFVISGYLISHKILYDISSGKFSFRKFYKSRIKRLVPALVFLVLIINLVVANFYTPTQLEEVYLTAIYSIFYLSNIYFLNNTGYFDTNSESQLYLHTWSLSIEEQFYLFMPVFLLFVMRKFKMKYFLVSLLFFISLFSTIFLPLRFIDLKFYLLPFRMWEFLLGTLVALYFVKSDKQIKYSNSASFILLLGMCAQFFIPYNILNHPGIPTFIICLITACLLITLKDSDKLNTVLNFKVFYFIGLISYSLYLWHDPIIKLNNAVGLSNSDIELFLIILVISSISYFFVENFFRYRSSDLLFYSLNIFIMFLIVGMFFYQNNEYKSAELNTNQINNTYKEKEIVTNTTLSLEQESYQEINENNFGDKLLFQDMFEKYFEDKIISSEEVTYNLGVGSPANLLENKCFITGFGYVPDESVCLEGYDPTKTNILFLGDSTSHNYYVGFKNILEQNNYDEYTLHVLTVTGCVPFIEKYDQNFNFLGKEEKCEASYKIINKILSNKEFDYVFVSYRYKYFYETRSEPFIPPNGYFEFERKLLEISKNTELIVIGPSLLYTKKGSEIHREILNETNKLSIFHNQYIDNSIFDIDKKISKRIKDLGITYVPILSYLCHESHCLSLIEVNNVLYPLLGDTIHYTAAASEFIAKNLLIGFTDLN